MLCQFLSNLIFNICTTVEFKWGCQKIVWSTHFYYSTLEVTVQVSENAIRTGTLNQTFANTNNQKFTSEHLAELHCQLVRFLYSFY